MLGQKPLYMTIKIGWSFCKNFFIGCYWKASIDHTYLIFLMNEISIKKKFVYKSLCIMTCWNFCYHCWLAVYKNFTSMRLKIISIKTWKYLFGNITLIFFHPTKIYIGLICFYSFPDCCAFSMNLKKFYCSTSNLNYKFKTQIHFFIISIK